MATAVKVLSLTPLMIPNTQPLRIGERDVDVGFSATPCFALEHLNEAKVRQGAALQSLDTYVRWVLILIRRANTSHRVSILLIGDNGATGTTPLPHIKHHSKYDYLRYAKRGHYTELR
jgi:hypothetical protein